MDLRFTNHGSIWIITPLTDAGSLWIAEHIPDDAPRWGANGVAVEARYVVDIANGARDDGLDVTVRGTP